MKNGWNKWIIIVIIIIAIILIIWLIWDLGRRYGSESMFHELVVKQLLKSCKNSDDLI